MKKNFDTNSLIGMLLMGGILVWIIYFNKPTAEEVEAQKAAQTEQVDAAPDTAGEAVLETQPTVASDSVSNAALQNRLGTFAYSGTLPSAQDGATTTISNDVLEIKVSNKGGHITEAKLLKHSTYDSIPVYLIKEGTNEFNLSFSTADNRNLNTKDLFFEPTLSKNGNNDVLSMKLKVSPSEYLEYRYELKEGDYMLDFGMKSQNLSSRLNTSNPVRMQWDFMGMRHARSQSYENRYTRLTYKYEGDKTDKLSPSGDDDEIEEDLIWMNYRQHFFTSIFALIFSSSIMKFLITKIIPIVNRFDMK